MAPSGLTRGREDPLEGTTIMHKLRTLALASVAGLLLFGADGAMAQKARAPAKPAAAAAAKPAPWPVVLSRTPYLKDGRIDPERDPKGDENRKRLAEQAKRYTDAGFVFVLQDVRGKGRSQGFYAAFENDIDDGYDAVEWAASQPWSNGKVGLTGGSALGISANSAAMAAPPHLKAAYVIVAPADRLSYSYPGGVLKDKDTIGWLRGQGVSDAVLDR